MNQRIKEVIVAVQNHRVLYAETNLTTFVRGMKAIDPGILSVNHLRIKLQSKGVYVYTAENGSVYEIYQYENPNYVGSKSVLP